MIDAVDELFLRRAIEIAERGLFSVTANPRVGCVIVKEGRILGRGAHLQAGSAHAEVNAIADAGGQVAGATVYVSMEPCSFFGRTPACAKTLIDAGVIRVVSAMTDPHPEVAGKGYALLEAAGITVERHELPAARRLNPGHRRLMDRGWPYVRIKIAQSLDGRTAMASGESQWITGPAARTDVQYWRARSGAVLTGIGTVLADDPALTVRHSAFANAQGVIRQPVRVVLDSRLRTPQQAQLRTDGEATLIFHSPEAAAAATTASPAAAVETVALANGAGGGVDLRIALRELADRGCTEVLVEAGAELVGALLAEGLWDELLVYVAPRLLGSEARGVATLAIDTLSEAIPAKLVATDMVGTDVRLRLVPEGAERAEVDVPPLGYPDGLLDDAG